MLEEEVRIITQEREKEGKQGNEEDRKEESHVASAPIALDVASTGVTQWSQRDGKDEKIKDDGMKSSSKIGSFDDPITLD